MKNHRPAKVLIIIPAYQEEDNILRVLEDFRAHLPEPDILVINDGSTDRTAARARQAGVKVIDLPFNLGIGAAVQTGFRYAAAHRYTSALQIDADYQHPAEEAPRLLKALEDEKADLVIGSRFLDQNQTFSGGGSRVSTPDTVIVATPASSPGRHWTVFATFSERNPLSVCQLRDVAGVSILYSSKSR